jgi:hypothetical protein
VAQEINGSGQSTGLDFVRKKVKLKTSLDTTTHMKSLLEFRMIGLSEKETCQLMSDDNKIITFRDSLQVSGKNLYSTWFF